MPRLSRILDTNICIHLIRYHPPEVLRRFEDFEVGEVGLSVITVAELLYGVEKSARPQQNRKALQQFLLPLEIVSFGEEATASYGKVRASLEKRGTPIGPLDTLIAAHALSLDATLVTNNTREFVRVHGLQLEDWTTP
ncbi:type II toxin-antitoxin system tRNA(fMet)-specific endonuclease VapC [Rubrobacter calidifluminis]|uniref:type II toxin-antitoxin system tRNA(fMet)-specific endonuclease VapC n=1 Tax=Rubrobacter calidifluminis TaxID=1392640 RepID=UPI002361D08E|nr:type II toxin-antitoxin system VapC family toxin [Rubrobacter calidifluminis]